MFLYAPVSYAFPHKLVGGGAKRFRAGVPEKSVRIGSVELPAECFRVRAENPLDLPIRKSGGERFCGGGTQSDTGNKHNTGAAQALRGGRIARKGRYLRDDIRPACDETIGTGGIQRFGGLEQKKYVCGFTVRGWQCTHAPQGAACPVGNG